MLFIFKLGFASFFEMQFRCVCGEFLMSKSVQDRDKSCVKERLFSEMSEMKQTRRRNL